MLVYEVEHLNEPVSELMQLDTIVLDTEDDWVLREDLGCSWHFLNVLVTLFLSASVCKVIENSTVYVDLLIKSDELRHFLGYTKGKD